MHQDMQDRPVCSTNLVSDWKSWEALRELRSNCLDADPEGFIFNCPSSTVAHFYTKSVPSYLELCTLGEGSKVRGGDTIGQFGGGMKEAAATANRLGGYLEILTADVRFRYESREEGGRYKVLWLVPMPPDGECPKTGCLMRLHIPGANFPSFENRFIPKNEGIIERGPEDAGTRIYCKGVFITNLPEAGLSHYNLNSLVINRDRAVPDQYSLRSALRDAIYGRSDDDDFLDDLLTDHEAAEVEIAAMSSGVYYESEAGKVFRSALTDKFQKVFGEKAVLSTGDANANEYATLKGHPVVTMPPGLRNYLEVKDSKSVMPKDLGCQPSKTEKSAQDKARRMLLKLARPLGGAVIIKFFDHAKMTESTTQLVKPSEEDATIVFWISDKILNDRVMLVQALLICCVSAGSSGRGNLALISSAVEAGARIIDGLLPKVVKPQGSS